MTQNLDWTSESGISYIPFEILFCDKISWYLCKNYFRLSHSLTHFFQTSRLCMYLFEVDSSQTLRKGVAVLQFSFVKFFRYIYIYSCIYLHICVYILYLPYIQKPICTFNYSCTQLLGNTLYLCLQAVSQSRVNNQVKQLGNMREFISNCKSFN